MGSGSEETPPNATNSLPASPPVQAAGEPAPSSERGPDERHVPVLATRVSALLAPAFDQRPTGEPAVVIDATLGMAGHTVALLQAHPELTVIGIDRDQQALALAAARLASAGLTDRVRLVHAVYDEIGEIITEFGPAQGVQGVLFDLGVSSLQLDEADRGFAYAVDAPLDMRMDPTTGLSAADVLNTYAAADLARLFRVYGEERFASRIAAAIVRERVREPFTTSARLVELIRANIPAAARRTGGHPAKRTFQALRIEVNDELAVLRRAVPAAVAGLAVGGRIVVLSYHSLEDRIVKQAIDPLTKSTSPLDLPMDLPGHEPSLSWLTRGSQTPTDEEITQNPRAASARLRAAVRTREAAV